MALRICSSNAFRKLAVSLILWTNIIYSVSGECSCYSYHEIRRSWPNSRSVCQGGNGDLVSMETHDEWKYIRQEIQTKSTKDKSNEWWIGLKYDDTKKQWKWLSNVTLTYNDAWQPNKPSNVENNAHAALIAKEFPTSGYKGSFNNVKESSIERGFICEYEFTGGLNRVCKDKKKWCSPTRTTSLPMTEITSTSVQQPSTITSTKTARNMNTGSPSSQPSEAKSPFPVYIIIIIALILLAVAFTLAFLVYRLKRKRELKPRNSHLSKDSRVPVKLDHNSSSSNLNDKIIYADVVKMDGHKIQINSQRTSPSSANAVIYNNITNGNTTFNKENTGNKCHDKVRLINDVEAEGQKDELTTSCLYANLNQSNACDEYDDQDSQEARLLYVQLADIKESDPATSPPPVMPEPYSETDYAVIVKPSTNYRPN